MNGKTENEKNETNNKNAPTETETDYKDKYIRLLAEFDNYKKFKGKENEMLKSVLLKDFITDLLTVLDDMENAIKNKGDDGGIKLIYNKFKKILEKQGLKEIEVNHGDIFNHGEHDAVLYVNDELPEGKIVKVVRKGYKLDNVIIRHPQVVVSKGKAEDDNKKNDGDDVKSIKHERNKGNEDNGGG